MSAPETQHSERRGRVWLVSFAIAVTVAMGGWLALIVWVVCNVIQWVAAVF
jgi:hypothetical protein